MHPQTQVLSRSLVFPSIFDQRTTCSLQIDSCIGHFYLDGFLSFVIKEHLANGPFLSVFVDGASNSRSFNDTEPPVVIWGGSKFAVVILCRQNSGKQTTISNGINYLLGFYSSNYLLGHKEAWSFLYFSAVLVP